MVFSGKVYDILKMIAQVWLPAAGTLYLGLSEIWHLPKAHEIVGSVVAIDTFLGVVLKISSTNYNNSDAKYDGKIVVEPHEDGVTLNFKGLAEALDAGKEEVNLKVVDQTKTTPPPTS